jgi:hypothetical protein
MTITFANGTSVEGITLVRTDGLMRVAVRGSHDAVEFVSSSDGTWLSESGEPVLIGERASHKSKIHSLDELLCPHDVMTQLLDTAQVA